MGKSSTQLLMDVTLTLCLYPSVYHRDQCSALHCSLCLSTIYRQALNQPPFTYSLTTLRFTVLKKTADEAVAQLDKALDDLCNWSILNRLTSHPQKSEAMVICKTRALGPVPPIHIDTDAIEWVKKSRLLGITVDDKLPWVRHMLDLEKTFAKKLDLIRRSRFLPKNFLINFYFKVILPSVTYGLVLRGSCFNANFFYSLQQLHCRAARIIVNLSINQFGNSVFHSQIRIRNKTVINVQLWSKL